MRVFIAEETMASVGAVATRRIKHPVSPQGRLEANVANWLRSIREEGGQNHEENVSDARGTLEDAPGVNPCELRKFWFVRTREEGGQQLLAPFLSVALRESFLSTAPTRI